MRLSRVEKRKQMTRTGLVPSDFIPHSSQPAVPLPGVPWWALSAGVPGLNAWVASSSEKLVRRGVGRWVRRYAATQ